MVSPEVALVEGTAIYRRGGIMGAVPLLFVMKKTGDIWKIASARVPAMGSQ